MTREEAIEALTSKDVCNSDMMLEALEMAIEALEQIRHLKGRPCEVCEYHTENGCSKWECVFKGV